MPLIECTDVSRIYRVDGRPVKALDRVNFCVEEGEFVTVIGRSGSGKSTLLNLLGCLDRADSGVYRLAGQDVARLDGAALSRIRNHRIGFIFQGFDLLENLTAQENVELPLLYRGTPRAERARLAAEALAAVGLAARAHHRPGQLSGGQQQRVAIARAIAAHPDILLADEPTGNLDPAAGAEVMALLRTLHARGRTVVLITHDPAIAAASPRRLHLRDGALV